MKCKHCGSEVDDNAVICIYCRNRLTDDDNLDAAFQKDWTATMLLAWFFWIFGAHCFYTGYVARGFFRLFFGFPFGFVTFIIVLRLLSQLVPQESINCLIIIFGIVILGVLISNFIDIINLFRNTYVSQNGYKLKNYNPTVKNIFVGLLCLMVLNFAIATVKEIKQGTLKQKIYEVIGQVQNKTTYPTLSQNAILYLKNGPYSRQYADQTRKMVVWIDCNTCPINKAFSKRLYKYATHTAYQKHYNFIPIVVKSRETLYFDSREEYAQYNAFFKACNSFCIINTKNNQIFTYNYRDEPKTADIYKILNTLKDW